MFTNCLHFIFQRIDYKIKRTHVRVQWLKPRRQLHKTYANGWGRMLTGAFYQKHILVETQTRSKACLGIIEEGNMGRKAGEIKMKRKTFVPHPPEGWISVHLILDVQSSHLVGIWCECVHDNGTRVWTCSQIPTYILSCYFAILRRWGNCWACPLLVYFFIATLWVKEDTIRPNFFRDVLDIYTPVFANSKKNSGGE